MTSIPRLALAAGLLTLLWTGLATASPAILLNDAALLDGPGGDYSGGISLPAGTHVDLLDCADGKTVWCLIDRRGKRGWVSLDQLDLYPGKKGVNLPGDVAEGGDNEAGPGMPKLRKDAMIALNNGGGRGDAMAETKGDRLSQMGKSDSSGYGKDIAESPVKSAKQ